MSNKNVIDLASFGSRLRDERLRLGFNQTDFAQIGGVQKDGQVKYEAGKREPGVSYLAAIAEAGVDILYLLKGIVAGPTTDDEIELLFHYRQLDSREKTSVLGLADNLNPHPHELAFELTDEEYAVVSELAEKAGMPVDVMMRRVVMKQAHEILGVPPRHLQGKEISAADVLAQSKLAKVASKTKED